MPPRRDYCVVIAFEDEGGGRFVVVRHPQRGWELPGGRVEAGEGPIEAAVREFREEAGHELKGARVVHRGDDASTSPWVVAGRLGPPVTVPHGFEVRLVQRLTEVEPLSFPDDDWAAVEARLGRPLR